MSAIERFSGDGAQVGKVRAILETTDAGVDTPLDKADARALTDVIGQGIQFIGTAILAAAKRQAHVALGYDSWDDYLDDEFGGRSFLRLPKEERQELAMSLADLGFSVRQIARTTNVSSATAHRDVSSGVPNETPESDPEPVGTDDDVVDGEIVEDLPGSPGALVQSHLIAPHVSRIRRLNTENQARVNAGLAVKFPDWGNRLTNRDFPAWRDHITERCDLFEAEEAANAPEPEQPTPARERSDVPRGPLPPRTPKIPTLDEQLAPFIEWAATQQLANDQLAAAGGRHKLEPLIPHLEDRGYWLGRTVHPAARELPLIGMLVHDEEGVAS